VRLWGVPTSSNQSFSPEISSDDDSDFDGFVDALSELPLNKEKDTELTRALPYRRVFIRLGLGNALHVVMQTSGPNDERERCKRARAVALEHVQY
jgi:hypothetical protein